VDNYMVVIHEINRTTPTPRSAGVVLFPLVRILPAPACHPSQNILSTPQMGDSTSMSDSVLEVAQVIA